MSTNTENKTDTKELSNSTIKAISYLLHAELELSNKIHNTSSELMRLDYESERGKQEVSDLLKSIRYSLDSLEKDLKRL